MSLSSAELREARLETLRRTADNLLRFEALERIPNLTSDERVQLAGMKDEDEHLAREVLRRLADGV